MGSGYFGKPNMGSDQRGGSSWSSSSSSSRRNKKGNSDKPKQPQRGLGVAQLEKMRLHEEMERCYNPNSLHSHNPFLHANFSQEDARLQGAYSSSPTPSSSLSYGFQPAMMGLNEYENTNSNSCWRPNNINMSETLEYGHPNMHREFLNVNLEDYQGNRSKKRLGGSSFGSSSRNTESSDNQGEVDLELRL